LLGVTLAVVLGVAIFGCWRLICERQPAKTAEAYIRAIASGDVDAALSVSSGSAAWSVSRLRGSGASAQVERVECSAAALGRGWARVVAEVELTLQDGSADVGWYSVDVARTGEGWKAVAFRETEPELSGAGVVVSGLDAAGAEEVFRQYLDSLAAGNWQEAAKCLAGPARRSQEMSAPVLEKGALIGKAEDLRTEPVWKSGKKLLAKHYYIADGREVSVTAAYFKTKQGWKIVKVIQN